MFFGIRGLSRVRSDRHFMAGLPGFFGKAKVGWERARKLADYAFRRRHRSSNSPSSTGRRIAIGNVAAPRNGERGQPTLAKRLIVLTMCLLARQSLIRICSEVLDLLVGAVD